MEDLTVTQLFRPMESGEATVTVTHTAAVASAVSSSSASVGVGGDDSSDLSAFHWDSLLPASSLSFADGFGVATPPAELTSSFLSSESPSQFPSSYSSDSPHSPTPYSASSSSSSSSSLTSSSSSSSASTAAISDSSRKNSLPLKNSRRRLNQQMGYDRKRRRLQKTLYATLRDTLRSAQVHWRRLRLYSSATEKLNLNETSLKQWDAIHLMDIESASTVDLALAASKAIQALQHMKDTLESKVEDLDSLVRQNHDSETAELLEALRVVNKKYLSEMDAVRKLERANEVLPRGLSDLSSFFSEMTVIGMDGTFLSTTANTCNTACGAFNLAYGVVGSALKDFGWRCASVNQLHAMAAFFAGGKFKYRAKSKVKRNFIDNPHAMTTAQILQIMRDSASSSSANQPGHSSDAGSSPSTSSSSFASGSLSAAAESLSDEAYESALLSHPLGAYSLPPSTLHAYFNVIESWLEMSPPVFEEQMDVLRPIAKKAAEDEFVKNVRPILPWAFRAKGYSERDIAFHPILFSPIQKLREFYALMTGKKSFVTVVGKCPVEDNGNYNRLAMLLMSVFCVREPNTGMPLAFVMLPHEVRKDQPMEFDYLDSWAIQREKRNQYKVQNAMENMASASADILAQAQEAAEPLLPRPFSGCISPV